MASAAVGVKAVGIATKLLASSSSFGKAVGKSVSSVGRDTVSSTARKIQDTNKKIVNEESNQRKVAKQIEEEIERRKKEGILEDGKNAKKETAKAVDFIIKKPLQAFWKLVQAWLIKNTPEILKTLDNTYKRVRIFVASVNASIRNTGSVLQSMANVAKAMWKNAKEFDFADKSGRLETANKELEIAKEDLSTSLQESRDIWTRPEEELDEMLSDLESGKTFNDVVRDIDQEERASSPPAAQPQTPAVGTGSGSTTASAGGWQPILDLIAKAESVNGSYDSIYPSSIKPGLSQMTIGEADAWQARTAGQRGSAAAGRYQFMRIKEQAALAGIGENEIFSPENQDKMAIALIEKKRGVTLGMVKQDPKEAAKRLAMEWAGLPVLEQTRGNNRTVSAGQSYYAGDGRNKATIGTDELSGAFKQLGQTQPQQPQAQPPRANVSSSVVDEFKGGASKSIPITSGYKKRYHPISGEWKMHKGIDIAPPGRGYRVALKAQGRVARVSYDRGYGNFVIIEVPTMGMSFMFAHLATVYVKSGQRYEGAAIGEIGTTGTSTGIHLHYEVYRGDQNGPEVNPAPYINMLSIGRKIHKQSALRRMADSMGKVSSVDNRDSTLSTISSRRTGNGRTRKETTVIRQTQVIMPA